MYRKVGDQVYCKSFGELHKAKIIQVNPRTDRFTRVSDMGPLHYRVQVVGSSFAWWIGEGDIVAAPNLSAPKDNPHV